MDTAVRGRMKTVVAAVVAGQTIEYYDFLLYGSAAALVFGPLFFPTADGRASTAAAFATFAIGFLMRPLGAVLFGHLGDRLGRRRTLIMTLALMGSSTTLIGALPTHEQVGALAPIALVFLRCLQGLALGGEWGGAALLAIEHAPPERRALWGSLPQMGSPLGLLLSTLSLLWASQLPDEQFETWGWRIPFLLTAVLMIVGVLARRLVTESPEFAATPARARPGVPFVAVVRSAPGPLIAGVCAAAVTTAGYYLVNTFTIAYVVNELSLDRDIGLYGQLVTGSIQLALVPLIGIWALRRDTKRIAALSAVLMAAWAIPLYGLLDTRAALLIWLAQGVATVFLTGVWALLPEILSAQFPTPLRYTGISLCLQGASIFGGFAPYAATRLLDAGGGEPWLAAALLCAVSLVSATGLHFCSRAYSGAVATVYIPRQRREAERWVRHSEETA